jgi:hypothetical protein
MMGLKHRIDILSNMPLEKLDSMRLSEVHKKA